MTKSLKILSLAILTSMGLLSCGGDVSTTSQNQDTSNTTSQEEEIVYKYDDEQKFQKFWYDEVIYNETLCFVEEDGEIFGKLLYEPTEIICVRDYTTEKVIDPSEYRVEGNKIIRSDTSTLPYFTQENLRGENIPSNYAIGTYQGKNGLIMFTEGSGIVMHQINVTYKHNGAWGGYIPKYQGDKLQNTINKLKNKEHLTIGFYGDSIMTGCNASSKLVIPPYLDDFPTASVKMLKKLYGYDQIEFFNTSKGGTLSEWGKTNIDVNCNAYNPDLVFLCFGMNDGSWNVKPDDYVYNMEYMVASIKARNQDAEVVILSSLRANPDSTQDAGQENYLQPLKDMVSNYEGVVVIDMTSYSEYLLSKKRSIDILANNINHPSDFLVRGFVSNIITTLYEDF